MPSCTLVCTHHNPAPMLRNPGELATLALFANAIICEHPKQRDGIAHSLSHDHTDRVRAVLRTTRAPCAPTMRAPSKRPIRETVCVALRGHATSATAAELVASLAQHTLFMHQQIPTQYAELRQDAEDAAASGVRLRPAGPERKAAKLIKAAEPLFSALPAALEAAVEPRAAPVLAAVLLGSSVASPRLVYLLRVSAVTSVDGGDTSAVSPRDAIRKLMRAVATQCMSLAAIDAKPCRLHVLLRAPREAQLPAQLFQPRPGLSVRLQRAHVARVAVECAVTAASGDVHGGTAVAVDADADAWSDRAGFVCGLRPPPPRGTVAALVPPAAAAAPATLPEELDGSIWWQSRALVKGFRLKA